MNNVPNLYHLESVRTVSNNTVMSLVNDVLDSVSSEVLESTSSLSALGNTIVDPMI